MSTHPLQQPMTERTAHCILSEDGESHRTTVTSNLWVSDPTRFADKTEGNKVQAFVTGKAYFADLLKEIAAARSQILIAGWQVNWDALLAPGIRLYDALYRVAETNPALMIYVMPWDDHEPVQTYDNQTKTSLEFINKRLGRNQVFVQLSPSYATTNTDYFSHHQKQVVIDARIAYVGGMDLCYGRYCDESYTLVADADGRQGLNRYNPCVAHVGKMPREICADPDRQATMRRTNASSSKAAHKPSNSSKMPVAIEMTSDAVHNGKWQPKYKPGDAVVATDSEKLAWNLVDSTTLDPSRQPRMPWQDVHCRVEGPAVSDLMRNFVDRWNIEAEPKNKLKAPPPPSSIKKVGQAHVQVLRSAPANHRQQEYLKRDYRPEASTLFGTQNDIYSAMLTLIEKSRRFIYIENQFFVSAFGKENRPRDLTPAALFINQYKSQTISQDWLASRAADASAQSRWRLPTRDDKWLLDKSDAIHPPTNRIVGALLARIKRSALSNSPFHVYITLPVHPEGCLCEASVVVQVYWTMQTISFGSHSLLNGIRRIIKARELSRKGESDFERVFKDNNKEYETIEVEACNEFITLLNLRNWAKLGDRYVTEQIYVHSKVMIVDDLYALIGSANINDRSLLGERDSELAILIMDGETVQANVNGDGSNCVVRKFAHELRKSLWTKLFGMSGKKGPANQLQKVVDEPGNSASWKIIQQQARINAEAYEKGFAWTPRNMVRNNDKSIDYCSILPVWDKSLKSPEPKKWLSGKPSMPMPFENEFWEAPRHLHGKVDDLNQVKGFIAALPINWTRNENIAFKFPSTLVTESETPPNQA